MAFALRIGSRPSRLALAQAELVKNRLERSLVQLSAEIVPIRTSGDKLTVGSLAAVGGKGLFVKELEAALRSRTIDIAVHSMKDMPALLPDGFRLIAVPERENPRDALISRSGGNLESLPGGARIGTSSPRRRFQALSLRPDLDVLALRGNVDTRLGRLRSGELDAVILAMAGLARLALIAQVNLCELDERKFVPAGGQGALAIEALADGPVGGSPELEGAIAALDDPAAAAETSAERAFLAGIGASCVSPVGVKGTLQGRAMTLHAMLFSLDGKESLADSLSCSLEGSGSARAAGADLARRMLARGAAKLIAHA